MVMVVFFATNHSSNPLIKKTVAEVVEELIKGKEAKGRSLFHTKDLRLRLGRFADAFHCPIASVDPCDIDRFLNSLKLSGRSKNNFRRAIGMLLKFSKIKGYVPKNCPGSEAEVWRRWRVRRPV